jgi:DNA-binding LacI/PurR family transcriptional regulator
MATIRDVPKEGGFSSTTVSFVLNKARLAACIPNKYQDANRGACTGVPYDSASTHGGMGAKAASVALQRIGDIDESWPQTVFFA